MACTARMERDMKQKYERKKKTATDALEIVRAHALSQGCLGIKSISRQFKRFDEDGNHQIDFKEFKQALHSCRVNLNDDQLHDCFDKIDLDKGGTICFDEFLIALRPPLSRHRLDLINQAFNKLDRTNTGVVTIEDLKGVYSGKKHPKYLSGDWSEEDVFRKFLETFDQDKNGEVMEDEFVAYYVGVSASIDNDAYFDLIMRQAWKL